MIKIWLLIKNKITISMLSKYENHFNKMDSKFAMQEEKNV